MSAKPVEAPTSLTCSRRLTGTNSSPSQRASNRGSTFSKYSPCAAMLHQARVVSPGMVSLCHSRQGRNRSLVGSISAVGSNMKAKTCSRAEVRPRAMTPVWLSSTRCPNSTLSSRSSGSTGEANQERPLSTNASAGTVVNCPTSFQASSSRAWRQNSAGSSQRLRPGRGTYAGSSGLPAGRIMASPRASKLPQAAERPIPVNQRCKAAFTVRPPRGRTKSVHCIRLGRSVPPCAVNRTVTWELSR